MAIIPALEVEPTVQVNDRTRLVAARSVAGDSITQVQIKPDTAEEWQDVTDNDGYYLDWVYSSAGAKAPEVKVTTADDEQSLTLALTVVTEAADSLLASDQDLRVHESDIFDLLKSGRSSFKDVHRRARKLIISQISEENRSSGTGNEITVDKIFDKEALRDWATYLALRLIFFDNTNSAEDKFERKAEYYKAYEVQAKAQALASVKFDEDLDGEADQDQPINFSSISVVRR